MLDWAKLQANELKLPDDQAFELGSLCQECIGLVKHLVEKKPVELTTVIDVPNGKILGAPLHLKQALVNLLTNAVKYTAEGTITLSAVMIPPEEISLDRTETRPTEMQTRYVTLRIAVQDTGVGVPEASRARIFNEFQQADARSVKAGTGLGLPLSCALVKLMGGRLEHSVPPSGRGSIFGFDCVFEREQQVSPEKRPAEAPLPLPGGLRALVADDSALNRKLLIHSLRRVLPDEPWFTQAESGEEALELLSGGEYDVAFLDQNFGAKGQLTGHDVTLTVRSREKLCSRSHRLVIIGVTGDQGLDTELQGFDCSARQCGQDLVWGKPFPTPDMMRESLRPLLGQRQTAAGADDAE